MRTVTIGGAFEDREIIDILPSHQFQRIFHPKSTYKSTHFLIIETGAQHPPFPGEQPVAIAAGDLADPEELRQVFQIARALGDVRLVLAVGSNAESPFSRKQVVSLRLELEDLGVILVERPLQADSVEKLGAFLDREYAPDPEALKIALKPATPIQPIVHEHVAAYLDLPPGDVRAGGDPYFVSHRNSSS